MSPLVKSTTRPRYEINTSSTALPRGDQPASKSPFSSEIIPDIPIPIQNSLIYRSKILRKKGEEKPPRDSSGKIRALVDERKLFSRSSFRCEGGKTLDPPSSLWIRRRLTTRSLSRFAYATFREEGKGREGKVPVERRVKTLAQLVTVHRG